MNKIDGIVELDDNELDKVYGGYTDNGSIKTFDAGDCFMDTRVGVIYMVKNGGTSQSDIIEVDRFVPRELNIYQYDGTEEFVPDMFSILGCEYINKKDTCGYILTYDQDLQIGLEQLLNSKGKY